MDKLTIRIVGLASLILGGVLFVFSVKSIAAEWPQIFVGLLSVLFSAMGFGLLIMPLDSLDKNSPRDDSNTG
jgi:Na+/phosphate symporter